MVNTDPHLKEEKIYSKTNICQEQVFIRNSNLNLTALLLFCLARSAIVN